MFPERFGSDEEGAREQRGHGQFHGLQRVVGGAVGGGDAAVYGVRGGDGWGPRALAQRRLGGHTRHRPGRGQPGDRGVQRTVLAAGDTDKCVDIFHLSKQNEVFCAPHFILYSTTLYQYY